MSIIPLIIPNFNFNGLLEHCLDLARPLDESKINLSDYAKSIVYLALFEEKNNFKKALNKERYLEYFQFSFLIKAESIVVDTIIKDCNLKFIINYDSLILTGNLREWRQRTTTHSDSFEVREIFNYIYFYFERLGLKDIFQEYQKIDLEDGTFEFQNS